MRRNTMRIIGIALGGSILLGLMLLVYLYFNQYKPEPPDATLGAVIIQEATTGSSSMPPRQVPDGLTIAKDFTVEDAAGEAFTLSSQRGNVVILNFWASWCPPCRDEMQDFQMLYDKYKKDDRVQLISVNLTYGRESKASADKFMTDGQFTFPYYYDYEGSAFKPFDLTVIPKTFFLDEQGVPIYLIGRKATFAELELHLNALLSSKR